ncbi:hypothetical protein MSP8886_04060 [Marinomonas spartinae]|uniref:Uncharacterized protein n=1 Tax=Marinomonas spartinae TaxID=1792290 RepID=A0A1A8TUK6_9GAMM|nr:hypothetical protein [Marinomonas spartinae]SBS37301.1 hypothetical protein MSP8886_04060 [Marinomonas spartinae]
MTQELDHQQAFQVHCLAQMGVMTWLPDNQVAPGTVFYPANPWPMDQAFEPVAKAPILEGQTQGFGVVETPPKVVAPEAKEQSVANLREQLNAGPDIIVEDLQPIEEYAVDIDVPVEDVEPTKRKIMRLELRAFALANQLLILTEVPTAFTQQEDIERLALKMGQALLKQPIEEWSSSALSWPGGLRNPYFVTRQDWLLGALEGFVQRVSKSFLSPPKIVLAGASISELFNELPSESPLNAFPVARIVSLPELFRIPELRKEAWQIMQTALF